MACTALSAFYDRALSSAPLLSLALSDRDALTTAVRKSLWVNAHVSVVSGLRLGPGGGVVCVFISVLYNVAVPMLHL